MPGFIQRIGMAAGTAPDADRGMHRTFLSPLDRGQRGLNIVQLHRIAEALAVRQADLLPEVIQDPCGASATAPAAAARLGRCRSQPLLAAGACRAAADH